MINSSILKIGERRRLLITSYHHVPKGSNLGYIHEQTDLKPDRQAGREADRQADRPDRQLTELTELTVLQ